MRREEELALTSIAQLHNSLLPLGFFANFLGVVSVFFFHHHDPEYLVSGVRNTAKNRRFGFGLCNLRSYGKVMSRFRTMFPRVRFTRVVPWKQRGL